MKKLVSLIICLTIVVSLYSVSFAQNGIKENPEIKINIDGRTGTYTDVPISINDRTLLPLRAILVNLGVQNDDRHIIWNPSEKSVIIFKDTIKIKLIQGSKTAYINDTPVALDAEPVGYSKNGRTYIPARFVAQSLQKKVFWDGTANTVFIITPADGAVSEERQSLSSDYAYKAYDLADKQNKPDEAMNCYDIAIELNPLNDQAHYWKALELDLSNRFDEAIISYENAVKANPKHYNSYYNIGKIYYTQKKYDEAIKYFDSALQADEKKLLSWAIYFDKGNALYLTNKASEASACFEKSISLRPGYIAPYLGNGFAKIQLKKYEESIADFDKCIENEFETEQAMEGKAYSLVCLNRNEEAIQVCDKLIDLNPTNAKAYLYKGHAYRNQNRTEEVKKYYDKAVELDPSLIEFTK